MKIKSLLPVTILLAAAWATEISATEVSLTLNAISKSMTFTPKGGGEAVATGSPTSATSPVYTFACDSGEYTASLFNASGVPTGSIDITVEGESQTVKVFNVSFYAVNKTDGVEWKLGTEYDVPAERISISSTNGKKRTVGAVVYNNGTRNVMTVPALSGDSYEATFIPLGDLSETYAPSVQSGTVTANRTVSCTLPVYVDFSLTAPKDAAVTVSLKVGTRHYVPFTEYEPVSAIESGSDMVYTYRLPQATTYNYRVSKPGCITTAGIFDPSKGDISVSEAELSAYTPDYYNHDVTANGGYNYADIYLNINPQGHLFMEPDGEFHLVNMRTWQLTNSLTANYFLEPDYHYTVLNTNFAPDNSVVEITDEGLLKAKSEGTAIVQVRYDAMNTAVAGGNLWSCIWAENTGTFVVTVGDKTEGIKSNMMLPYEQPNRTGEIDAEHDIFYYPEGADGFDFTFTPEGASTVTVANPAVNLAANSLSYPDGFSTKNVTKNADGSYTVRLTYGRNIVCLTDGAGKSTYQVVSAKPASYTVGKTVRNDTYNLPGDAVVITYKGLYHDAGKLAAIYNQACVPQYATLPAGYGSTNVKGTASQYTFPVSPKVTVTLLADQQPSTFVLSGGCLTFSGFGDKLGGHRDIDYLTGRNPNFIASAQNQLAGVVPDVTFSTDAFSDGMELSMSLEYGKNATPVSLAAAKAFLGDDLTITSSDEGIAKVDANGKVTAVADGKAVVTYSSADASRKFICNVDVWSVKAEGLEFSKPVVEAISNTSGSRSVSLPLVWTPSTVSNKSVSYEITNPEVLEMRNNIFYTVAGKSEETDVIARTADGALTATCHVIIRLNIDKISFDSATEELTVGESLGLVPVFTPENTDFKEVKWTSDNAEVASVDENGVVTALKEGSATITATSTQSSSVKATVAVTVKANDQSGIGSVSVYSVKAWPNPFTDYIMVESPAAATAGIYNLQGALLISTEIEAGQNRIATSALAPGLYLVRVGAETVKMIRK